MICKALKSGSVSYSCSQGGGAGVMLIKDIQQVEIKNNKVVVTTNTGREMFMNIDFSWMIDLFE